MARPLRIEFPGALYHVISRGNERSPIFRDDEDRRDFLDSLAAVVQRESFRLHSYCLMGNHYHLLVETPLGKISRGMHWLNGRHALRFNARHERCGHLLEGRFKAIVMEKETHLLELERYIVLNPVRAALVEQPQDWDWSSYRATIGLIAPPPSWLEIRWTLRQFGRTTTEARRAFIEFVEAGIGIPTLPDLLRTRLSGSDTHFGGKDERFASICDDDLSVARPTSPAPTLDDIERIVAREWNVCPADLRLHRGGPAKVAAIYLARRLTRLPVRKVAAAFGVRRGRVANVVAEVERGKRREMRSHMDDLMSELRAAASASVKKTSQKCQVET